MVDALTFRPLTAQRLRDSGLRIVITGASGWLGQASLEMIEQALGPEFSPRVSAFGSHSRSHALRSGTTIHIESIDDLPSLKSVPTLLLHYAFVTKDRVGSMSPQTYFATSEKLSAVVEAAIRAIGVRSMLFPSSGAVYGLPPRADRSIREEPEANPYGTQKLRDEARFSRVSRELGLRLAIPRVFNLSGPFINKLDAYALGSAVRSVLQGTAIEIRARRRVVRGYVAVEDLLEVAVGTLLSESSASELLFDTGGESLEVGELCQRVRSVLGRPDLEISRPPLGPEPDDIYLGDGSTFERLAEDLGVRLSPIDEQVARTAAYIKGS